MPVFLYHYLDMWRRYFDFAGRTNLPGFWWAFLCNLIISGLCGLLGLGSVYIMLSVVPALALTIRRINDTGKHWLWILINFVPLIGQIIFIVMLCLPSKSGDIIDV